MAQELDHQILVDTISMQMVLAHYNVDRLHGCGTKLHGRCPIHPDTCKTFQTDLTRSVFECSESRGEVLDFVAGMERSETRDAAFWRAGLFGMSAHVRLENWRERP